MDLGRLPPFPARSPEFRLGAGQDYSACAPRAGLLPPLLPMLRRASPLAQYPRARPAAAMTIRNATTGLNGTNPPMTLPTASVRALLIGGPRLRLDRR
jgi:hypothetical protein